MRITPGDLLPPQQHDRRFFSGLNFGWAVFGNRERRRREFAGRNWDFVTVREPDCYRPAAQFAGDYLPVNQRRLHNFLPGRVRLESDNPPGRQIQPAERRFQREFVVYYRSCNFVAVFKYNEIGVFFSG